MGFYDRFIVPPFINLACGANPIRHQRRKIVPLAKGEVLELGFGTGLNLPYYEASQITRLFALEPAPGMLKRARKAARQAPFPVEILAETAEALSLPPASVDTVLVTYSLCTIPDPVSALQAARRVLKPGGRLLFCEHGKAPDAKVQRSQARIEPFWSVIAGGCRLCRDIPRLVCDGGFEIETLQTMYLPSTPPWAGFNYWGAAR